MGDGSGDDVRAQLAALLGKPLARIGQIRKTDENPPRISVIDVVSIVASLNGNNAAMTFARLKDEHPDLTTNCGQVKFTDCKGRKGNRGTPVTNVRGIVEITMLLPGHYAARVRRQAADLFVRYLGSSLTSRQ